MTRAATHLRPEGFLAAAFCLALAAGCSEPGGSRQLSRMMEKGHVYEEREEQTDDPAAIATVRSIAVFPLHNASGNPAFDAMAFSEALAQQLTSRGVLMVISPREVDAEIRRQQRDIDAHNRRRRTRLLLGKQPGDGTVPYRNENTPPPDRDPDVELAPIDPVRNTADAIRVARILKADVIFTGVVTSFDPYYRPRVGVTLRAISTGQNDVAADALTQLAQWGVPRGIGTARGQIWMRQQLFDANNAATARETYLYARTRHTEANAYDTEVYLRSIDRFFEFVGSTLARGFLTAREDAILAAEESAREAAKRNHATPEVATTRIRALTRTPIELPDADVVMEKNHRDNIDRSWRPDIYLKDRPDKATYTPADPTPEVLMRRE